MLDDLGDSDGGEFALIGEDEVKVWPQLMVTLPFSVLRTSALVMFRPALRDKGMESAEELIEPKERSRTAFRVSCEELPAIFVRIVEAAMMSPFPAAALAVLRTTAFPTFKDAVMAEPCTFAAAAVGVKTFGFPPLNVPPDVALPTMLTSLAAWTRQGERDDSDIIARSLVK